jgi:hypothetical protein
MAHMLCECGERLSNTMAPNDIELRVYTDKEWDDIINMGEIDSIDIPFPQYDVWLCPKCKRIHVWKEGSMERVALYELVESRGGK